MYTWKKFKYRTIKTVDITTYIEEQYGHDLSAFFQQYLFEVELPVFQYFIKKRGKKYFLNFKWDTSTPDFDMPILAKIKSDGYDWIYPDKNWKKIELKNLPSSDFHIPENLFLIDVFKVK